MQTKSFTFEFVIIQEVFQLPSVKSAERFVEGAEYWPELKQKLHEIGGIFLGRNLTPTKVFVMRDNVVLDAQRQLYIDLKRSNENENLTVPYGYNVQASK